jgi:hypothetical protein
VTISLLLFFLLLALKAAVIRDLRLPLLYHPLAVCLSK